MSKLSEFMKEHLIEEDVSDSGNNTENQHNESFSENRQSPVSNYAGQQKNSSYSDGSGKGDSVKPIFIFIAIVLFLVSVFCITRIVRLNEEMGINRAVATLPRTTFSKRIDLDIKHGEKENQRTTYYIVLVLCVAGAIVCVVVPPLVSKRKNADKINKTSATTEARLEELQELKSKNLISDEEFEKKRQQILSEI